MKTPGHTAGELVGVANILYWHCSKCKNHVPWYRIDKTDSLTASCCGVVWTALPRYSFSKFYVAENPVDMSNVRILSHVDR